MFFCSAITKTGSHCQRRVKNHHTYCNQHKIKQIAGHEPLPIRDLNDFDFSLTRYVGEGGFGVVVVPNNEPTLALKLIKYTKCQDGKEESNVHNNIYLGFMEIGLNLDVAHISQPYFYSRLKHTITYDSPVAKKQTIGCVYGMEYLEPINIGENILKDDQFGDRISQLHIANIGTDKNYNKPRGFWFGNIALFKKTYTNILKLGIPCPNFDQIFYCVGYIFAVAFLYEMYNPDDLQFMLSIHHDKIKVIGFDFGGFKKIDQWIPSNINVIFDSFISSPYLGAWITEDPSSNLDIIINMTQGIVDIVKIIVSKYGVSCPQYQIGYTLFVKKLTESVNMSYFVEYLSLVKNEIEK